MAFSDPDDVPELLFPILMGPPTARTGITCEVGGAEIVVNQVCPRIAFVPGRAEINTDDLVNIDAIATVPWEWEVHLCGATRKETWKLLRRLVTALHDELPGMFKLGELTVQKASGASASHSWVYVVSLIVDIDITKDHSATTMVRADSFTFTAGIAGDGVLTAPNT